MAELEIEIQSLRERMESATDAGLVNPHRARGEESSLPNLEDGADAERVVLRKVTAAMSKDELIAALDRIAGSASGEGSDELLEECLVKALIEQDPELALTRYADRISDPADGLALQLPSALLANAHRYPTAAAEWLDLKISEGLFEGRSLDGVSEARTEFEASLNGVLLSSDVNAASKRLADLPDDQRREVLEGIEFSRLGAEGKKAYVDLLRETIRENENAVSFDHIVSELIPRGGLAEVSKFFGEIEATQEDRGFSGDRAASEHFEAIATTRQVTGQDLDTLIEWLERQCPENAVRISATVLAEMAANRGSAGFAEGSRLLLESRAGKDNDEILAEFLESDAAYENLPNALELAGRISDGKLRTKIIGNLRAVSPP